MMATILRSRSTVPATVRALAALGVLLGPAAAVPLHAVPTDGTYTGTVSAGGTVTIQVSGGQVTSFALNNYTSGCATLSSSFGGCSTTGDSFTCGQPVFCAPDGAPRIRVEGTFSGAAAAGDIDLRLQGPAIPIPPPCCSRDHTWTATRQGGGGTPGSLRFSVAAQSVQDAAGSANVSVQRTGGTTGAVTVQYASGGGTATAGSDFSPVSGTLSWAAGDGAAKSFQVPILGDTEEENDETLTLTLSSPTGGATLGTPSSQTVTILDDDGIDPEPCVEDDHTLCLLGDRFRVRVDFTPPQSGIEQPANAIPFTDRAGMFWFFNSENVEMLVKLQNACVPAFDRYWVFFAATTNVEFTVTVTDTQAVQQKTYDNPQGMVALPVADTQAFDTCP